MLRRQMIRPLEKVLIKTRREQIRKTQKISRNPQINETGVERGEFDCEGERKRDVVHI